VIVAPGVPDPENIRPTLVYSQLRVELSTGRIVGVIWVGEQLEGGLTEKETVFPFLERPSFVIWTSIL
jgi:hypothetical protein